MIVEVEIEEETLAKVDEAIEILKEKREDVFREMFRELAKKKQREAEVKQQYTGAYFKNPQSIEEIEDWQAIQHWDD